MRGSSSVKCTTPGVNEESILQIKNDLTLLSSKLAEINGEPSVYIPPPGANTIPSSPFVAGIRNLKVSDGPTERELKLQALEKVLTKIVELDRAVLKKTAPEVNADQAPVRRKSRGFELFSIPTHLHLIDRLMDLHTQAKRVTILRTTLSGEDDGLVRSSKQGSSGESGSTTSSLTIENARLQCEVEEMRLKILDLQDSQNRNEEICSSMRTETNTLQRKLRESEEVRNASDKALIEGKELVANLMAEVQLVRDELEKTKNLVNSTNKICSLQDAETLSLKMKLSKMDADSSASDMVKNAEIAQLQTKLLDANDMIIAIEKRYKEDMCANQHQIIQALNSKAVALNTCDNINSIPDNCVNLYESLNFTPELLQALIQLDGSINVKMQNLFHTIEAVSSVKDMLEGEISTYQMENSMLNKDMNNLTSEHEALKTAYQASQSEVMNSGRKAEKPTFDLSKQLEEAKEMIHQLQAELHAASRRTLELERLPSVVANLESNLRSSNEEKLAAESSLRQLQEELEGYKKLTESLQEKMKVLSGKDQRDFLDSFEEVMRDEMMTMKLAFEAKLKAAKSDSEAASKRHFQEIQNLKSSGGSPLFNRKFG